MSWLAAAAGLDGSYRGWLSWSSASPSTRFTRSTAPYVRVDGTTVANDWSDLTTNGLRATITLTERGMPARTSVQCGAPAQAWAFSDTLLNGTVFEGFSSCSDWTGNGTVNGAVGDPTKTTEAWTRNCVGGGICGVPTSLYCFEQ